jgi:protein TonB
MKDKGQPSKGPPGGTGLPPGYGRLLASAPRHGGRTAAKAGSASLAFHAAVVAVAVWVTMSAASTSQPEEQVTVVELPAQVELPPPPPPMKAPKAPPIATPKGFQTLVLPDIVKPEIPPPSVSYAGLTAADFTGEGVEGGRGKTDSTDVSTTPSFTPYTVAPSLKNRDEVERELQEQYPPLLRDAGIGGSVVVWLFIDDHGDVQHVLVKRSSGSTQLDGAAERVGTFMRFSPAFNRDRTTAVWVSIPITFQVH